MKHAAFIALILLSCQRQAPSPQRAAVPQIKATVVTIRTTVEPDRKTLSHQLVIAGELARSGDEHDRWRLFDLRNKRVTVVDEISRSHRTETFDTLLQRRRARTQGALDVDVTRPAFSATGARRTIAGIPASQALIRSGAYVRELWIGNHPRIPPELFAIMHGSRLPAAPLAPFAHEADEALLRVRGFPLLDRAELKTDGVVLGVERLVVSVEERNVPAAFLKVPPQFRDETEAQAPKEASPQDRLRRLVPLRR